jgi:hypothetical protein
VKANDFGPLPEPAFGVLAVDGDTGRWCEAEKGEACFDAEQMIAYAAQAVAAERERWIAKAGAAYTDAHAIFNDPPSETTQAVRDVIEWHLHAMRTEVAL